MSFRCFCLIAGALTLVACGGGREDGRRVIVLGIDGMDYGITRELIAAGRMPNFARLADQGSFGPLETSIPPQSPVAWSNVTTGMDSGGHGIFDFVHRDPESLIPIPSMLHVEEGGFAITVGRYQFPLSGGSVELTRRGRAFWEVLEDHGVESSIFRMPVNFPPIGKATRELSGMGTTDLKGVSGEFSFYTSRRFAFRGQNIDSGAAFEVEVVDGIVDAELYGPDNPFIVPDENGAGEPTAAPFTVYVDAEDPVAKLVIGDEERVLRQGDWSDWVPISFDLIPTQSLPGMVRFYLKSVRPDFELYVSPIDFDPLAPAAPISHPASFAAELAEALGRFYTEEMPEDAKANLAGILDFDEYLVQAKIVGDEYIDQYDYALENYNNGFLFYYFGNLDQVSHTMWHTRDPGHPMHDAERDAQYANVIDDLYISFDEIVGRTLEDMGEDTILIVMSDHGFGSFRRTFDLNAWLVEHGYLTVIDEPFTGSNDIGLLNVDWSRTRAYNAGLNSLYLNVMGREAQGIVPPEDREALVDEIRRAMLATIDPQSGAPAITKVYARDEEFSDGGARDGGPDIIVGFAEGTRTLGRSAAGAVLGDEVFADNTEDWSGDHEWDHETVPGVWFTSQPLERQVVRLQDVAQAILAEFDIDEPVN
jgi:predicted AlkP superfamily phosphohydrolase/phosphomutase